MNRRVSAVLIAVWCAIAAVLIVLLVLLISFRGAGTGWNFNFSGWPVSVSDTAPRPVEISKSFAQPGIKSIDVEMKSADVEFSKAQGDEIGVKISGRLPENADKDNIFTVEQSGDTLRIVENSLPVDISFFNWNSYSQRVSIELPQSYASELTMALTSGDVRFSGDYSFSNLDITQTSGDITADGLSAPTLDFRKTSGDTDISSLSGDVTVQSTSGDFEVGELSGSGSIHSLSGDLSLGIAKLGGDFDVGVTSGDVRLSLKRDISAAVDADATSGSINADFPLSYSGMGRHHATATLGSSPKNSVTVQMTSGDVQLSQY